MAQKGPPDRSYQDSDKGKAKHYTTGPSDVDKFLAKAKTITATPKPTLMQRLAKEIVGYPYPWEVPTAGDLVGAGLPFASYIPKIGRKFLMHGTGEKAFEYFDPSKGFKEDILGHFQPHTTPKSEYASSYASKGYKQPRMIPVVPEAQNVLDLYEPSMANMDDLSQALAAVSPEARARLIRGYKNYRSFGTQEEAKKDLQFWLQNELNNPQTAERLPFDAIRYNDIGEEAWTFPRSTVLKTPWGTPLTEHGTPLKLFKHNKPVEAHAQMIRQEPVKPSLTGPTSEPFPPTPGKKSYSELTPEEKAAWKPGMGAYNKPNYSSESEIAAWKPGMPQLKLQVNPITGKQWSEIKSKKYTINELIDMYKKGEISYGEFDNLATYNVIYPKP